MKNNNIFFCKTCLNTSTRPRITFDQKGICNACIWSKNKKKLDWNKRVKSLLHIVKKNKKSNYDVLIPVSGGKDGSYITYILREKYNLNPLCVTVNPPLRSKLGHQNLENFKKNNIDLIEINLPSAAHMKLNKLGFKDQGRPLYGWLIAIFTAAIRVAESFKIDLIMYGEDGETEYGGVSNLKDKIYFDKEFIQKIYLSNKYNKTILKLNNNENFWWSFSKTKNVKLTHWSYFENWDSYKNYVYAKKYFGYKENEKKNVGTYTNFSQNDTKLYDLHCYLMYIKFGFGRAIQDIGIDIRRGSLSRTQGVELAKIYDNEFPYYALQSYLEYFKMSKSAFFKIIDKFANKRLFKKEKNIWKPKFIIE